MYATHSDIEARLDPKHLAELADDNGDGLADASILEAAIADADALIDAHLESRYSLPLATVPPLLCKISADLAVGNLFARRRESSSPLHQERADASKQLLGAILRGELFLAGAEGAATKGAPESTMNGEEKVFSRDSLNSF